MQFQPTTLNERISALDILRGVSLLGILLVNMFAFYLPLPHIDLADWFTEAMDIIWHQILDIYVQSSFYPLFSILFGYGIMMQFLKAQRTGAPFYKFASKRLIIIFILGLFHAFFIWWGDILTMYAFCGFLLLLLLKLGRGWLLTIALGISGLLHFFMIGIYFLAGMANTEYEPLPLDLERVNNAIAAYGNGSWTDAFIQRLDDLSLQLGVGMWISALFTILPYLILGAAAAKWQLIERAKQLKVFWITLAIIFVGLGLFIKSAPYTFTQTHLLYYLKIYVGGPILSIGYIAAIVSFCLIPFSIELFKPFAKVGRMSLTLYVMQSIVGTLLFYQFGFGLYGEIDVKTGTLIAIGIFVAQLIFAELWFLKFKQGPLEGIIKKITYKNIF